MSIGREFWAADVTLSKAAEAFHTVPTIISPYDVDPLDLTLFVSCYNEQAYIAHTLDMITEIAERADLRYEVIVIDDTSRDGSRDVVIDYIRRNPTKNILLRANKTNKGLAQNYMDGAFLGRGKYYRLICGDHAETPESTLAVFKAVGQADIIVPYYTDIEGKNLPRRLISNFFTGLINTLTGNKLHYYNGLAVHLRRNVMRWHSDSRGFGFQADILCRLIDLGFSYQEVAMVAIERREGKSNALTFRNLLSVAHTLLEIGIRRISNRVYRKR
ncbi:MULTISPECIES: glycosyltransferase [unclassified Bradyrhizobium]|uniref:glycosyltransferase n=1 Tax=unclassified Bradyrhizobium TaxID=2631580 RepID=UPI002915CCFB|nr:MULTISPECIES: glycosyltransferase [unclassified Bradyrhizobium]